MTQDWTEIMGLDPYELQLSLSAGEAVARFLRHEHPVNTAKLVAKRTGMDARTVENILDRHLSGPTLTKLILAYRSRFVLTLGAAVMGIAIEDDINREIEEIAHERRELEAREAGLRARHGALRARRAVDARGLRLVHPEDSDTPREVGGERRGVGPR